jgi:hypothetical protein
MVLARKDLVLEPDVVWVIAHQLLVQVGAEALVGIEVWVVALAGVEVEAGVLTRVGVGCFGQNKIGKIVCLIISSSSKMS